MTTRSTRCKWAYLSWPGSSPSINPVAATGGQAVIYRPELAMATIVAIAPVLLVFLFAERNLVAGMLAGSSKE